MASVTGFGQVKYRVRGGDAPNRRDGEASRLAAFRVRAAVDDARSLNSLIECEIIPRLMVAHAFDTDSRATDRGATEPAGIVAEDVETLAPLALQVEADALLDHVDRILRRGVSVDTLLVDLLAPAARKLGEYWEEDRCDFVDVTMGLWRLQEIVHELAARLPAGRLSIAGGHRALFASMPGDQHSFGAVVIDEIFCREGWLTDRLSEVETSDLLARLGAEWFDLLGLTISQDCHIARLPSLIAALRNVSVNPRLCVMVGGRVFLDNAELAMRVGADGTARDARLAVKVAGGLVAAAEREALDTV